MEQIESINLTLLKDQIIQSWKEQYKQYFSFLIDKGHLVGVKALRDGSLDKEEIRIATKYEITIFDCWNRAHAVLSV